MAAKKPTLASLQKRIASLEYAVTGGDWRPSIDCRLERLEENSKKKHEPISVVVSKYHHGCMKYEAVAECWRYGTHFESEKHSGSRCSASRQAVRDLRKQIKG